jgi:hypothetical protein
MGKESLSELAKWRGILSFDEADFAFSQSRSVSSLDFPSDTLITLTRAGLNAPAIENEFVPVDIASLKQGHFTFLF